MLYLRQSKEGIMELNQYMAAERINEIVISNICKVY